MIKKSAIDVNNKLWYNITMISTNIPIFISQVSVLFELAQTFTPLFYDIQCDLGGSDNILGNSSIRNSEQKSHVMP